MNSLPGSYGCPWGQVADIVEGRSGHRSRVQRERQGTNVRRAVQLRHRYNRGPNSIPLSPGVILDLSFTSHQPGTHPSASQTPLSTSRKWYRVECAMGFDGTSGPQCSKCELPPCSGRHVPLTTAAGAGSTLTWVPS